MEPRDELLEEREQLKQEYNKWLKVQIEAYQRQNDLLPHKNDTSDGTMTSLRSPAGLATEYEKTYQAEHEAAEKAEEILAKISEINVRLQSEENFPDGEFQTDTALY